MDDRKQHIIEATAQLYLRHGIRSITMDDVASELGISKKTLYQLFKDKAELVNHVVCYFLDKDRNLHANEDGTMNAIDRVLFIRKHIFEMLKIFHNNLEFDLKKFYPETYQKIREYKRDRIYDVNYSILEQGKNEGLFREDVNSDLIARLIVGRFLFVFNPDFEIFNEEEVKSKDIFDNILDYHFHGICTENGIKYFKQQLNNVQNEN